LDYSDKNYKDSKNSLTKQQTYVIVCLGGYMKITKYKKSGNDKYQLFFEDGAKLTLYEDVIIKNNLLIEKEVTKELFDSISKDNDFYSIYIKCIKNIGIRCRSEFETREYLKKRECSATIVEEVVAKLKNNNLLNDEAFVSSYINDKILMTNSGPLKLKRELLNHKINEKTINQYLDKIDNNILDEKIDKIITKFIKSHSKLSERMLQNKLSTYLNTLGYNSELYSGKLGNINVANENELCKKEYDKMLSKLSKKYEERELNNKLKQKLCAKGFNWDTINSVIGD